MPMTPASEAYFLPFMNCLEPTPPATPQSCTPWEGAAGDRALSTPPPSMPPYTPGAARPSPASRGLHRAFEQAFAVEQGAFKKSKHIRAA